MDDNLMLEQIKDMCWIIAYELGIMVNKNLD